MATFLSNTDSWNSYDYSMYNGSRGQQEYFGSSLSAAGDSSEPLPTVPMGAAEKPSSSKLKEAVDIMNTAAVKLFELKYLLQMESRMAMVNSETENTTLQPLVTRFAKQIDLVDSLKDTNQASPDILGRRKEKYNYYFEEELQAYDLEQANVDNLQSTMLSTCNFAGSSNRKPRRDKFNGDYNVTNSAPDNKTGGHQRICYDETDRDRTIRGIPTSHKFMEVDTGSESKLEAAGSFEKDKTTEGKVSTEYHVSRDACPKSLKKINYMPEIEVASRISPTPDFTDEDSEVEFLLGLQRRPKMRPRLQDVFPIVDTRLTPSPRDRGESPQYLNGSVNLSMHTPGSGDTSWANKSKVGNESWFDFKERCSTTSLQERLSKCSSPFSPTAQSPSSPFTRGIERTYDTTPSPYTRRSTTNIHSIRKSAKSTPKSRPYLEQDLVSSSSDDDEVRFDVKQFPCADHRQVYKH